MSSLKCIVVTPEQTALEAEAEFVALPLYDGEIGIAPGHTPLIGRLGCGELRLRSGNDLRRYYVDGGFVQIADNTISVLTGKAVPANQLSGSTAEQGLRDAFAKSAATEELSEIREQAIARARAQIRIARRSN